MTAPTFVGREDELAFLFARQSEAPTRLSLVRRTD